jgi:hypothetical protein
VTMGQFWGWVVNLADSIAAGNYWTPLPWAEGFLIAFLLFLWARAASRARTYRRACNRRDEDLATARAMLEEMAKTQSKMSQGALPGNM